MKIEEAIKRLRKIQEEQEDMIITGKLDDDIFYDENVLKDFEKDNEAIETLLNEYEKQKNIINKTIKYIEKQKYEYDDGEYSGIECEVDGFQILKILKGE